MDRGAIVSQAWKLMLKNKGLWGAAAIILIMNAAVEFLLLSTAGVVWSLVNTGVSALFAALLSGTLICMIINILDQRPHGVAQGIRDGLHWLLPLFVLHFLLALPNWILSVIILNPASGNLDTGSAEVLKTVAILFLIQLPIGLLCSAILVGAERAAIVESNSVGAALKRGWQLLWTHLGDYWGVGIRLFLITLGVLVVLGCGVGILRVIVNVPRSQSTIEVKLASTVLDIFLSGFVAAAWTLAFREWQAQEHGELSIATE